MKSNIFRVLSFLFILREIHVWQNDKIIKLCLYIQCQRNAYMYKRYSFRFIVKFALDVFPTKRKIYFKVHIQVEICSFFYS